MEACCSLASRLGLIHTYTYISALLPTVKRGLYPKHFLEMFLVSYISSFASFSFSPSLYSSCSLYTLGIELRFTWDLILIARECDLWDMEFEKVSLPRLAGMLVSLKLCDGTRSWPLATLIN